MTSTGIKNNIVNEIARKFETIARSNSSDSSNSSNGLSKNKRHSNDSLDALKFDKKPASTNTIAFQQVKHKMSNFNIKSDLNDSNDKNFDYLDSDDINFTIESNDTKRQSTIKRKNGLELFNINQQDDNENATNENEKLKIEIKSLRDQLEIVTNDLTQFRKKYQEFQLEIETNEKYRSQQVDKLRRKVDFLLKMSFSNSITTNSYDDQVDVAEHVIKF